MKLQKKLEDSGFVIIATHVQNVPKDKVIGLARSLKMNYSVTSFGRIPGDTSRGIPHAFLFDSNGNLAAEGHPMTLKSKVEALVASSPHFLAAGREYTKCKPIADALKKTKMYGSILKKLKTEEKRGGEGAEEAKYLSERILAYGEGLLKDAQALESEDAFLAYQRTMELAKNWKYSAVGDKAKTRLKEQKKDKEFQKELKASTIAHRIIAECDKLVMVRGKINLEYSSNKKIASRVKAMVPFLKKKYPETKAAASIGEKLKPYGFSNL